MEEISIRQLSQTLKWKYNTVITVTCRPEFNNIIQFRRGKRTVKIEDIPKVTELIYDFMNHKQRKA